GRPGPHRLLGGLLLPLLLRVAVEGQVAAAVGRPPAELALAVGRQRVVGRVVLVALGRARPVGGRRRPGGVVGGAARAELRAQLGRRLEAAAAAGALGPRLALQAAAPERVVVLGRRARRAAHQARQVSVLGRPPARGAVGPAAIGVGQGLPAAAPRPVVLLQGAVLVEAPVRSRLRALEAAPTPGLVAVALRPAGPWAVGVGEGRQLVHGDGRHPGGKVLPRQHLGFGTLLALSRSSLLYSTAEGPRLVPLLPPMTPDQ
uniref:Secreted protein n=1 Tax=Catagonus wagneri TaxID=51154 RepID=A0A8C3WVQ0_9CETA